jgi:hypothetical protein
LDLDLEQIDRANEGIDRLIESRAAANHEAQMQAESLQRYSLRRAAERRREWAEYPRRMIAVAEDLAERHRDELGRLIDGAAREPCK